MNNNASDHYNEKYFAWQSSLGEFGGWANQKIFEKYISSEDRVLDFGCGGGWLVSRLHCKTRIGVEINPAAVKIAKENGIEIHTNIDEIPDEYVDVIISNHALEHTLNPLQTLKILYDKLKQGGKIIFVVPCESIWNKFQPGDINHHLYTWNPMCLGNLFTEAGFLVVESKPLIHQWPPGYRFISKIGGRFLFDIFGHIFGLLNIKYSQVRIVAKKTIA